MSVRHGVLGLLLQKPDYPYKLVARFEERIGPGWQVNVGQVYQSVYRLEEQGLIEQIGSNPTGRGERCVYRATGRGSEEFARWLNEDADDAVLPLRGSLFVKLVMSGPEHAHRLVTTLDRHERTRLARVEEYSEARRLALASPAKPPWKAVMFRLVLEAGIGKLESEIEWIRRARREIALHSSELGGEGQGQHSTGAEAGGETGRQALGDLRGKDVRRTP